MTTRIQNLSDLQDRRIMMEKKLPAFGYALILLVAFLMVFLVIWSTQNKRTYVSQSTGSVQEANKTYIMSSYYGSITELTTVLNKETTADEINEASRLPSLIASTTATTTRASCPPTSWATPTVACSIRPRPTSTPLTA